MDLMFRQTMIAVRALLAATVLLGIGYPLAVWVVGSTLAQHQASGSLIYQGDVAVGSELIGQNFGGPRWFHSRPSVAGDGYDALASGASNLGPNSETLLDDVQQRRTAYEQLNDAPAPPDALTASGSGLDPHISVESATRQARRVASANGLSLTEVNRMISEATQERILGFMGEERVNVLLLNLAIARSTATTR